MKIKGFAAAGQAMTPVPTAFLANEVPDAPADYVKVYLYGLYLAGLSVPAAPADVEERLHMKSSEIEDAFEYWERRGLVRVRDDGTVYFGAGEAPVHKEPFPYVAFNMKICSAFGRDVSAYELQEIYSWLETFSFPQEVAVLLVAHCIERKGNRVHINYMSKMASVWADHGVDSVEAAEVEIETYRSRASGARQVMIRMGICNRQPGKTELDLYEKWTTQYGFTHEAIMRAMEGTEFNVSAPFKYLDAVLRSFHESGAHTPQEIAQFRSRRNSENDEVKEALQMLGCQSKVLNREQVDTYRSWKQKGHDVNVILLACARATRYANRRMEHATQILEEWSTRGLTNEQDIRDMLAEEEIFELQVQEMYQAAGIDRELRDTDLDNFRRYIQDYHMDNDVLMLAAKLSAAGHDPMAYMLSLLKKWAKASVTTVAEAQAECKKHEQEQALKHGYASTPKIDMAYVQRPPISNEEAEQRSARSLQILKERYGTA